mgnify:CR=1 FL=1
MKILYAEDEKQLSAALAEILKMNQYEVDAVYDGAEAWEHLQSRSYDAVILDIMMPEMDGIEVLQRMREMEDFTPVMLLTAKAETEDRITGLTVGADDYLAKPFSAGELLARLNAMIRRTVQYKPRIQTVGNITLDCEAYELKSGIGGLRISSKEAKLLSLFIKNQSNPLYLEQIKEKLRNEFPDENVVILYISYLKNKLKQIGATVNILQSGEKYYIGEVG